MLVGLSNRFGLEQTPFSEWYHEEYGTYELDNEVMKIIKDNIKNVRIKLFMGTWCRDSKREVPRIYRILDAVSFDKSRLTLINLDRTKSSPKGKEERLNIHHVPTLILYRNGIEIGRIIESPIKSLEKDIAAILTDESYTPNYSDFGGD